MPKLTRYLQKIFANNSNEVGVFGTGVDKETSKNVETLQSADYEDGWSSAIITNKNYPIWQERDGVDYGFSYQLAYLMQAGIPEWLSTETYYTNSYCRIGSDIYYSLQDDNTNHNPTDLADTGWWFKFTPANTDLSNLSVTGLGKFVQRVGDTMTGTLGISTPNGETALDVTTESGNPHMSISHNTLDRGTTYNATQNFGYLHILDKNGDAVAGFGCFKQSSSDSAHPNGIRAFMRAYDTSGNATYLNLFSDGSTTCPASDNTNSILTTVKKVAWASNKTGIELGNGLIIQWGYGSASSSSDTVQITFPIPFATSNHYYAHANLVRSGSSAAGWGYATSQTTTSCTFVKGDDAFYWFAVGY